MFLRLANIISAQAGERFDVQVQFDFAAAAQISVSCQRGSFWRGQQEVISAGCGSWNDRRR